MQYKNKNNKSNNTTYQKKKTKLTHYFVLLFTGSASP